MSSLLYALRAVYYLYIALLGDSRVIAFVLGNLTGVESGVIVDVMDHKLLNNFPRNRQNREFLTPESLFPARGA